MMRTKHWRLLPGFLLGLVLMQAVGWDVASVFGAYPVLMKLHWAIWLILSLVFPALALVALGKAEERPVGYLASYLLNAAGAGYAFGIVLSFLEVPVQQRFAELMISTAFPALTAFLMCLLFTLWRRTRWIAVGFTFLMLPAVVGCLLLGREHGVIALGGVFGFLFLAALPISCGKVLCGEPCLEQMAFSGFGTYLIVVLGAIFFLLEDGPDGGFDGLFDGITDVASGLDNQPKQKRH